METESFHPGMTGEGGHPRPTEGTILRSGTGPLGTGGLYIDTTEIFYRNLNFTKCGRKWIGDKNHGINKKGKGNKGLWKRGKGE